MASCTATTNMKKYYAANHKVLDSIESVYKREYQKNRFTIEFTDKSFNDVSIEFYTDTVKYVYVFGLNEARLNDSLRKFHLPVDGVQLLLSKMRAMHCTWINKLDYYVDEQQKFLVYLSIRPRMLTFPLSKKKYYILSYFSQPQYYDSNGNLLVKRKRREIRKINDDVFKRINNRVAYTISGTFR